MLGRREACEGSDASGALCDELGTMRDEVRWLRVEEDAGPRQGDRGGRGALTLLSKYTGHKPLLVYQHMRSYKHIILYKHELSFERTLLYEHRLLRNVRVRA